MRAMRPVHLILIYFSTLVIFGEGYKILKVLIME
jgi:hypothetical protein